MVRPPPEFTLAPDTEGFCILCQRNCARVVEVKLVKETARRVCVFCIRKLAATVRGAK